MNNQNINKTNYCCIFQIQNIFHTNIKIPMICKNSKKKKKKDSKAKTVVIQISNIHWSTKRERLNNYNDILYNGVLNLQRTIEKYLYIPLYSDLQDRLLSEKSKVEKYMYDSLPFIYKGEVIFILNNTYTKKQTGIEYKIKKWLSIGCGRK